MWIGRRRASTSKWPRLQQLQAQHTWRTRSDPLEKVWPEVSAMLRDAPELEARTLFDYFLGRPGSGLEPGTCERSSGGCGTGATEGPEREVFFAQEHPPGALLQLDWTHARELGVTIQGEPLDHLFCHCVLPYSNWEWATRCLSESFLSLVAGLQAALAQLGKCPLHLVTGQQQRHHARVGGAARTASRGTTPIAWNCARTTI